MTPTDIQPHTEKLRERVKILEGEVSDPSVFSDPKRCRELNRELQQLNEFFAVYERWLIVLKNSTENKELLQAESDPEMVEMIQSDVAALEKESENLEMTLRRLLIPPSPHSGSRVIVEVHPAAGGEESALFAGELYRAYMRYAEQVGWKMELLSMTASDLDGVKEVMFALSGDTAYDQMRFESGVHRVQRIPLTEAGGRIHTSTVTVAVLPEAEDVDIEIKPEDLRIDVYRASGAGGQHVNKTDSAVRITHIPTHTVVECQSERSQHRNREIAMRILRSRILEQMEREEAAKRSGEKRSQVGTGDRSERIRTYNFPQSRCTDHRYGISVYDLPNIMEGYMANLFTLLIDADAKARMDALAQIKD